MNKIGYIYKITSPNNRIYIGQTTDIKKRINHYKHCDIKKQPLIFNSIKKYGWSNHKFEIICAFELDKLNEAEKFFIYAYKANAYDFPQNGMNLTEGGEGSRGIKHSSFSKQKNRIAHLGKKMSIEHKQKTSEASLKRWQDPEYRNKVLSKMPSNKGIKMSEEQKQKLREANTGKKQSEESKNKNRIASTGRKHSDAARKKISDAKKEYYAREKRTLSEETKRKISEAGIRRYQKERELKNQ